MLSGLRIQRFESESEGTPLMSDKCSSRHFSWLTKSCFPTPQQQQSNLHHPTGRTTISSLPDDVLLECLSRVPQSSLHTLSQICLRWFTLLDSPAFTILRRRRNLLHSAVFTISINSSGLSSYSSSLILGENEVWKRTISFELDEYFVLQRAAAIGRQIYLIGRNSMLRCDTWTGKVNPLPEMLFPRKKFAVSVIAGKIYVAGGISRSSAVEEYNPDTKTWRVIANSPKKRYGCIGASVSKIFYIIGGLKIGSAVSSAVFASSMDLYDVEANVWLRSRAVPGGGCIVAACALSGHVFILASHAVELSFWKFNGCRISRGFGEWHRIKSPPLPAQVRLDNSVRFSCIVIGDKVVLIQILGCTGVVFIYDILAGEWLRGPVLPELSRRAACVCVEF